MNVQTSLLAYQSIRTDLTRRQEQVYNTLILMGGQGTMHEVAMKLLVPLNTISGRFSELERKGWIKSDHLQTHPGRTPRTVYIVLWPRFASGVVHAGGCEGRTTLILRPSIRESLRTKGNGDLGASPCGSANSSVTPQTLPKSYKLSDFHLALMLVYASFGPMVYLFDALGLPKGF